MNRVIKSRLTYRVSIHGGSTMNKLCGCSVSYNNCTSSGISNYYDHPFRSDRIIYLNPSKLEDCPCRILMVGRKGAICNPGMQAKGQRKTKFAVLVYPI